MARVAWVIGPLLCGTGHVSGIVGWVWVVFGVPRVVFLLVLPISPRSGAGGDLDKNWQYLPGSRTASFAVLNVSLFRVHFLCPTPVAGGHGDDFL